MTMGAAHAMLEFGRAIEQSVDTSVRALAPVDDPAVEITWAEGNLMHLAVTLQSGRVIRGSGPARLEAVLDAADRTAKGRGRRPVTVSLTEG